MRQWVEETAAALGHGCRADLEAQVRERHGEVPGDLLDQAIADLIAAGRLYGRVAEPAGDYVIDSTRLPSTLPDDIEVATPAQAAVLGWIALQDRAIALEGEAVLALLRELAQAYKTGARSTISLIRLGRLTFPDGGYLDLTLTDLRPEAIRNLDEWLDPLLVTVSTAEAEAYLEIANPEPDCKLAQRLQAGG